MSKVFLNTPAPDFVLEDYNQKTFRLSELVGRQNVLLVFNRGFT